MTPPGDGRPAAIPAAVRTSLPARHACSTPTRFARVIARPPLTSRFANWSAEPDTDQPTFATGDAALKVPEIVAASATPVSTEKSKIPVPNQYGPAVDGVFGYQ